jgi:prolipoprotein diacylglyceryltransferase
VPTFLAVTAVIELAFTPIVTVGAWNVRLETIALAIVLFAALALAVAIGRRTPVDPGRPADDPGATSDESNHLRADDLLFIAVAALPGAVAGGRLGYALLHLDYYGANPAALVDASQGGFQLSLAIIGGALTAAIVAGLLGAPIGRWMHAMTLPLLFAIAGGKIAMILGGDGQGQPFDGAWATAYLGSGPWGSLAPEVPSHPAQAYEALATVVVLLVMMGLLSAGAFRRRGGGAFVLAIALWAVARALVAISWRDPAVVGPLGMDQAISISIAIVALVVGLVAAALRAVRRPPPTPGIVLPPHRVREPDWPDPESRPRF